MAPDVILKIPCPAELYQALTASGLDSQAIEREGREGLALRLYASGRLSLGQAAELAGMSLNPFIEFLRSLGLPVVEYGQEEYTQDLQTIDRLLDRSGPVA